MIQPGLERISLLLKDTHFPWKAIHVAGTNGKGSTCHYAANLLRRRAVGVGKFTSPHLVDRWDCIEVNREPVKEDVFKRMEESLAERNVEEGINASPFEILTATAFNLFNKAKVEFGVIEVGMGGTLDATNILNNHAVSIITKIAKDHENFLGSTIEEIARHKAGILRPNVPYIVNPMNDLSVQDIIDEYAKEIGAGPRLVGDTPHLRATLYSLEDWKAFASKLRPFQQDNAVLAIIAVRAALNSVGKDMANEKIADELLKKRSTKPGRLEFKNVIPVFGGPGHTGRQILIDGAHNPDAALALDDFIMRERRRWYVPTKGKFKANHGHVQPPRGGWSVTWVLAMTEGKDATQYLRTILKSGDTIITTTFGPVDGMPWVKPMDANVLLETAKAVQPRVTGFAMPKDGVLRALCAARYMSQQETHNIIALTGSLYFVGDLHRELEGKSHRHFWTNPLLEEDRQALKVMHKEEQGRVSRFLKNLDVRLDEWLGVRRTGDFDSQFEMEKTKQESPEDRKTRLQAELEAIDKEMDLLAIEELQQLTEPLPGSKQDTKSAQHKWGIIGSSEPEDRNSARPTMEERPFSNRLDELTRQKQRLQRQLNEPPEEDTHFREAEMRAPIRYSNSIRPQYDPPEDEEEDKDLISGNRFHIRKPSSTHWRRDSREGDGQHEESVMERRNCNTSPRSSHFPSDELRSDDEKHVSRWPSFLHDRRGSSQRGRAR